jgi:hypothetical protein
MAGVLGLTASPGSVLLVVLLRSVRRSVVRCRTFGLLGRERGVHACLVVCVASCAEVGVRDSRGDVDVVEIWRRRCRS